MEKKSELLDYKDEILNIESHSVEKLAETFGTPLYAYSESYIRSRMREYNLAVVDRPHLICYAVKANWSAPVLQMAAREGLGADIVSGGELFRALRAGIPGGKIVYSGVGKTQKDIEEAVDASIGLFSVESEAELELISKVASRKGKVVPVSIRINPNVDPKTHPYISTGLKENKFGIEHERTLSVYERVRELPGVEARGIGAHIGSQLTSLDGYRESAIILRELFLDLNSKGHNLDRIDVGGGLGIQYDAENPPTPAELVTLVEDTLDLPDVQVIFEPGRSIVGNSGFFITRILYNKWNGDKKFHICDGAMNDLIRPSLYDAYHRVQCSVKNRPLQVQKTDLVGPVCESGDFLAKNRHLPDFQTGDLAVIESAGAYGSVMASNYNSRVRPAEILLRENGDILVIRERESYEDLVRNEWNGDLHS